MEVAVDILNLREGDKYNVRLQSEMVAKSEPCSAIITMHRYNSLYSRPTCGGDASQPIPNHCVVNRNHRHQVLCVRGQIGKLQGGDCAV